MVTKNQQWSIMEPNSAAAHWTIMNDTAEERRNKPHVTCWNWLAERKYDTISATKYPLNADHVARP